MKVFRFGPGAKSMLMTSGNGMFRVIIAMVITMILIICLTRHIIMIAMTIIS